MDGMPETPVAGGLSFSRGNEGEAVLFGQKSRTAEFETAALPHLNDLYRTAGRLLGDRAKAEDVVQEVYLQAWKSFDRFEIGTNCRAWLFKILFHSIHHYRRKWYNLRVIKESDEFLEQSAAYTAPVPERLTDEDILSALDRIPPDFKAVVLLADVEDFSYKEVADILKIPIGTVMSRLSRGRKLLREHLAGVAQSYGIRRAGEEGQRSRLSRGGKLLREHLAGVAPSYGILRVGQEGQRQ